MNRVVVSIATCALLLAPGCKKQPPETKPEPRVSVQRPMIRTTGQSDWATTVYPARYERADLPTFPEEAIVAQVAHATVRADFNVLADGQARDVRFTLTDDVPEGERFIAACNEVLARWRFSPAWRLARGEEHATTSVVLIPSKAHLIFHFDLGVYLAGGDVEMSFDPGGS